MYVLTDDPVADFADYDAEMEREANRYYAPKCEWCGRDLDEDGDEFCAEDDAHELICMYCVKEMFMSKMEDYLKTHQRCIPWMDRLEELI